LNRVAAIVVAGGRGERFGTSGELPKQFLMLEGEPVFIWSLKVFCQHPQVGRVVLVVVRDLLQAFQERVQKFLPDYQNKIAYTSGGAVRQSSVLAGLEYLTQQQGDPPRFVLIHDAVRPFVEGEDLDKIIEALAEVPACTLALPITDTLKQVKDNLVLASVERQDLYSMQTPQGSDFATLLDAHRSLDRAGIETTDDVSVLERAMSPPARISVIIGSPRNFKITTEQDFYLAQALAAKLKAEKKVKHYI
jgi:2-C-methyl-D-erythritol 4-phosphate cytidylyltransferase